MICVIVLLFRHHFKWVSYEVLSKLGVHNLPDKITLFILNVFFYPNYGLSGAGALIWLKVIQI